jgi:hypothetical protein
LGTLKTRGVGGLFGDPLKVLIKNRIAATPKIMKLVSMDILKIIKLEIMATRMFSYLVCLTTCEN